ncbi:30S ribosomal protein S6 [Caminicella sporogenes]|uniref:30S ribosomal protein S6 n=1 Tax=Caminicella sporogenes TaxID=166485 RepID=UPI00253F9702|nr:30S ribosomal protein S6 [Caminicella sporogenes]WIF95838.1 30S ribosomal protein S6 [Caminicella sporogenes]
MRKYEAMFIVKPDVEEERRNELISKFKSIIETNGEVENIDEWGIRKLAYEINKYKEGYYVLMNFKSGADLPKELERNFRITDEVIRYMVVNVNEK